MADNITDVLERAINIAMPGAAGRELIALLDAMTFETLVIDSTNQEALLVRQDADGGDIFVVDTTDGVAAFGGVAPVTGTRITVPTEDDAATPTIAFGDGDSGFYEETDDILHISIAGVDSWRISADFQSATSGGAYLRGADASAIVPGFTFRGDTNTGVGTNTADELSLIAGGSQVANWKLTGNHVFTSTLDVATGNEIALDVEYTVNKSSSGDDTGLRISMTDTASPGTSLPLDIQVGGTSQFSINSTGEVTVGTVTPVAGTKLLLPQEDDAVTPTIAFGDGDTGIYESVDDALNITINGVFLYRFDATGLLCGISTGDPLILDVAGSTTVPSYSFNVDTDTGMSRSAADAISLITGGTQAININSTQAITCSKGCQSDAQGVTSTSDGLTTGLILSGSRTVDVTSTNAANIITLPADVIGNVISIYTPSTGCELRTPASSNETINNVDSDGTNELALAASSSFICECVAAGTWIVRGFDNLGADLAALVPDAA